MEWAGILRLRAKQVTILPAFACGLQTHASRPVRLVAPLLSYPIPR